MGAAALGPSLSVWMDTTTCTGFADSDVLRFPDTPVTLRVGIQPSSDFDTSFCCLLEALRELGNSLADLF